MSDATLWITVLLTPAVLGLVGFFAYVERQARLLKTHAHAFPGGLRFEAHGWSVELQRANQLLVVKAAQAHYTRELLAGGAAAEPVQGGAVLAKLPAVGLRIEVSRMMVEQADGEARPTGLCRVEFQASDETQFALQDTPGGERHLLRLENVPGPVATDFQRFAGQIRLWVEKQEHQATQQLQIRQQRAEAEAQAQARAEERARKAAALPEIKNLDPDSQIAHWRQLAGYSGISEVGLTQDGKGIEWFIDLDPRGRLTLHADRRTVYTTLLGATVNSSGGELELSVRDDYWTEAEPELKTFRLFRGVNADVRRAWKERLEILIDKLRNGEITPV